LTEFFSSQIALQTADDLTLRPIQSLTNTKEGFHGTQSAFDDARFQFSADARIKELGFDFTPSTRYMLDWPLLKHLPHSTRAKDQGAEGKTLPFSAASAASVDGDQQPLGTQGITSTPYATGTSTPASFHYPSSSVVQPTVASVVGWETVQPLSKAYFNTFNQLHPIVDENWFMNSTVGHIMNGTENSLASAIGFLILALGEMALAGTAAPIPQSGRPSSIQGSTMNKPPGLAFFNEARQRMGLFDTEVSVQNLQAKCLSALYFASCGRAGVSIDSKGFASASADRP
jgi:hypothetical protein